MHDVVREVTLAISRKAKFCMILGGSQSVLNNQTSHVSIQTNDESLDLTTSLLSLSRLRSLVAFSICNFSSGSLRAVLIRFKTLRVLELQRVRISNLPNEVSALFNLHYLGLTYTQVEQLPNNIQKLQSLQTLDLRDSRIKKLPHGVTQLKQLRHLFATYCEVEFGRNVIGCFPTLEGACQWRNLQTLQGFKANEKLVQLLGDMKELRSLRVIEVEQAHCPQLCTSLTKMSYLRRLFLFSDASEGLNFEMLNNSPPPLLQKLYLRGRLFEGKMPRFICSCAELTHVFLWDSMLMEDPLPSFGQLPKLAEFCLMDDSYGGQKLHFKTGWFLNLKLLWLDGLKNSNDIVIEEGAMTSLRELFMIELREVKMVPRGIEFLSHLKVLSLRGMSEELREKLRNDNDNEDRQRIRHILNVIMDEEMLNVM